MYLNAVALGLKLQMPHVVAVRAPYGRAVRQLFGNLNQCTPIDDLNRRLLPVRARSQLARDFRT